MYSPNLLFGGVVGVLTWPYGCWWCPLS